MKHMIDLRLSDSEFPHVRVIYEPELLTLHYGEVAQDGFKTYFTEKLSFESYPELKSICDGVSWHLTELYCLFDWHGHHITLKERQRRLLRAERERNRLPLTDEDTLAVYEFLVEFFESRGWAPSVVEIAEGCYMGQGTILRHLSLLEARGYLRREAGKIRAMALIEPIQHKAG